MAPLPQKDNEVDFSNFYNNQQQSQTQSTVNSAITEEVAKKRPKIMVPIIILLILALIEIALLWYSRKTPAIKPATAPPGYEFASPPGGFPYFKKIQK